MLRTLDLPVYATGVLDDEDGGIAERMRTLLLIILIIRIGARVLRSDVLPEEVMEQGPEGCVWGSECTGAAV